jgi:hypothetical protein
MSDTKKVKLSDIVRDICNAAGWPADEKDLEKISNTEIRGYVLKEMSQADMVREIKKMTKTYHFDIDEVIKK